jgi:microcystin-dependent protein
VGTEGVTLIGANTPAHTHTVSFSNLPATLASPKPVSGTNVAIGANTAPAIPGFYVTGNGTIALRGGTVTPYVGGVPHENRQQFLALNYIIAYAGVFPSQG